MKRFKFSNFMLVAGLLFIYLPMVILVIYSFNDSPIPNVWSGFTLKWYAALPGDAIEDGLIDVLAGLAHLGMVTGMSHPLDAVDQGRDHPETQSLLEQLNMKTMDIVDNYDGTSDITAAISAMLEVLR